MKIRNVFGLACLALVLSVALIGGCKKEETKPPTPEQIEKAGEKAAEKVEEAGEKAAEKVEEAGDEAGKKIEESTEKK